MGNAAGWIAGSFANGGRHLWEVLRCCSSTRALASVRQHAVNYKPPRQAVASIHFGFG
jgi:hypothetical protein